MILLRQYTGNKDDQFYLIANSPTDVGRERTDVASPQVVLLPLVAEDLQLSFLLLIQNVAITDLRNRLSSSKTLQQRQSVHLYF